MKFDINKIQDRSDMTSILQYLVLFYGSSLYREKEQLSNLLADLYLGEDRLKRLYRRAIMDDDLSRKVYELSLKQIYEREVYLKQIIATFVEKNFIAPDLGKQIVDSFVAGLGLETKSFISTKVFEEDGVWKDEFGVKYSLDKRKLLEAPNSIKGLYKIREETVAICDGAFSKCFSLSSIIFSHNLALIGDNAFEHTGLTSIEFPPNLLQIGDRAFCGCSALANIKFGTNLKSIGNKAFAACGVSSVVIPFFVASISDGLFSGCTKLSSVKIHDNLKVIGEDAFSGCFNLTDIDIPHGLVCIGNNAFCGCSKLYSLQFHENLETIGRGAFKKCENLTHVDLPQSLTRIGKDAFLDCKNIHYINIPSDLTIESGAFAACSNLSMINLLSNSKYVFKEGLLYTSDMKEVLFCVPTMDVVQLPPTIERIVDKAFYGCDKLIEIKLPSSLLYIGDYAFYNCQSLHKIKLPERLKEIGNDTFEGTKFSFVSLPASLEKIGCPFNLAEKRNFSYSRLEYDYINIPKGTRMLFEQLIDKNYHNLLIEGSPFVAKVKKNWSDYSFLYIIIICLLLWFTFLYIMFYFDFGEVVIGIIIILSWVGAFYNSENFLGALLGIYFGLSLLTLLFLGLMDLFGLLDPS